MVTSKKIQEANKRALKKVKKDRKIKSKVKAKKRKVLSSEIKRSYKRNKSISKTIRATGASRKQVQKALEVVRLTKRDKLYNRKLVSENKMSKKDALRYILDTKALHRRERRAYQRAITPWIGIES